MDLRRSFLTVCLMLGLVVAVAACQEKPTPTPRPSPTPTPAAATPAAPATTATTPAAAPQTATPAPRVTRPEGVLRIAVPDLQQELLDPSLTAPSYRTTSTLYETYYAHQADGSVRPQLLREPGQSSADGLTWTFRLREGVKFHDGTEMTSEDAKFSLERYMSPASRTQNAPTYRNLVTSVEVVDRYTFRLHLKGRWVTLPYFLANRIGTEGIVLPKAYIERVGWQEFNRKPVGTSPWRFVRLSPGEVLEFEAVEGHWRVTPAFKTLRVMVVPEETTRLAMLRRGDVEAALVSPRTTPQLKQAGLQTMELPATAMWRLHFYGAIPGKYPPNPLQDVEVRKALNLAVNKQAILNTLYGGAGYVAAYTHSVPGFTLGAPVGLEPYPYNPEEARRILSQKYPAGLNMKLWATNAGSSMEEVRQEAEAIAGYWQAVGVKVEIVPQEYAVFRPWIVGPAHDPKIAGTAGTFNTAASPLGFRELATFYTSRSATKLTDLADPYVSAIDKAETLEEVNRITEEAYQVIYKNYIGLPLFHGAQVYGVAPNIDFQTSKWLFPTSNDSVVGLGSAYAIKK